ncbi:cytochrome c biogenesis protein ResB [Oscillatoria sp. CS-180]|uniref:cytochrome c biogenesis protein ResB n=1 Tax=Oscillatoria sp. CS-180 TaxID=3021720 RepID=UPI00232D140A|nr:cytochrome c biogenesis protein ResB [Oscillatoria sp. CS-180]MDB9527305.1 cytochrome c biogenesis protein ResB [Oscillatoria sp. CS-180]
MESRLIRFLSSIRLAVPLLVAIALILVGATFYESEVGSATVQRDIYKSAWFGALMFLLAVNLGLSTLSRFPWKGPRKLGFALTHWGLVIIIAGSAAVIHLSTEGMLLVRTDSGPGNQIRVEGDLLEVIAPRQTRQQADIFIRPDGSVYPHEFAGLTLLGYSESAIKTVQFVDGGAVDNPAVKIRLQSDRMGQTLDRWLAVAPAGYSQMDIGPAHLEIFAAATEAERRHLLSPPSAPESRYGELKVGDRVFDIEQTLGRSIAIRPDTTLEVTNVWPDFRLEGGQPASASSQFHNPAIQVTLVQGETQEQWFVFANAEFPPVRSGNAIDLTLTYEAPQQSPTDYFRIVTTPDHHIFYAAASSKGFKSGAFSPDEAIAPGWADFQISLVDQLTQAQVQRQVVPVTPVADGAITDAGSPALHVAIPGGQEFWLPWGEPTTLETPTSDYFAAFSPKMIQLPFYVKLNDFIVERNEGSESVAMWTSQVTLFDPQTDTAVNRAVWMNHPTWFRGWKLAQASWNPGDLQQSTLQLKREPWWVTALTWTGSVLVVLGISTMFYGPGLMKKRRKWSRTTAPNKETSGIDAPNIDEPKTIPILAVFSK